MAQLSPVVPNIAQINGIISKFGCGDVQSQVEIIKELPSIASSIGAEKTRDELIPFLQVKSLKDKEVLLELLKQLQKFVPLVGGAEHFSSLLPIIEIVLFFNDDEVYQQTIGCLKLLFKKLAGVQLEQQVVPFIQSVSKDTWAANRAVSCGLFNICYLLISDSAKKELLKYFRELCLDEDLFVRLAAVSNLGDFAKCAEFKSLESDFVPMFVQLQEDTEDSVRTLLIDAFFGISAKLIPTNVKQFLMPSMRKLLSDNSHRVRHKVAERISELQKAVGAGITKTDLVPTLSLLLKDPKAEVRAMAMQHTNDFCKNLDKTIRESFLKHEFLPQLKILVCDPCQQVRLAACEAPHFGQYLDAETIKEHLLPLIIMLMEDVSTIVSQGIASNLGALKDVVGIQIPVLAEYLLPVIINLSKNAKMSTRLSLIENLPILAKQLGPEFFDKQLTSLCILEASDNCFIISESAIWNLKLLFEILGCNWVKQSIIPQILEMFQECHEVTLCEKSLALIKFIVDACEVSDICEQLLPIIFRLAKDQTTSIRNLASKILHSIANKLIQSPVPYQSVLEEIKPVLVDLSNDTNADIKQFTLESLNAFFPSDSSIEHIVDH